MLTKNFEKKEFQIKQKKNEKKLYVPFVWMRFNCLKATRSHFTF